jgi:methylenetetrahydrofolate reductase (NADPH)
VREASVTDHEPGSALEAAVAVRRFIVTAEVTSPTGGSAASLRRRARLLCGHVLAANVPDGQAATAHVSPLAAARLLLDEGLEPVLTLQCRDRNRLALQSELLGAAALGVRNVLCLTGDRPPPDVTLQTVFELDSVGLLGAVAALGEGRLLDGAGFRPPARLFPGVAAHPFLPEPDRTERLRLKAEAGARFVQTQYVFDVAGFARWLEAVRALGLHEQLAILATVGPPRSPRVLEFLRRLPGVALPAAVERRFAGLDGEAFAREGLRWCAETAAALADLPGVAGVHFIAPFWEEEVPGLIAAAGLAGRTERA